MRTLLLHAGFALGALLMGLDQAGAASPPPNVIFILADDLGYGDLGCYGSAKIRTPVLDNLAAEGMRFTQAYSASPVCAPARCMLLTAKNSGRGLRHDHFGSVAHQLALRDLVFRLFGRANPYAAAWQRYLLVQPMPNPAARDFIGEIDSRFIGGLAIYDAPNPWGPWTTAFFTEHWDVGPGDSAAFPTKWMSADGRTLYLVFSGDDSFSVRKAQF